MRRLLIVLFFLVLVLALAMPWLVGLGVQARFAAMTAEDNRIAGRQVSESRLARGWFASEVVLELEDRGADPWIYRADIAHGPFTGWPVRWASARGILEAGAGEMALDWWIPPAGSIEGQLRPTPALGSGSLGFAASSEQIFARLRNLAFPPLLTDASGQVAIAQTPPDAREWTAHLTVGTLALQRSTELDALVLDSQGRQLGEALEGVLDLTAEQLRFAQLQLDQPRIHLDLTRLHLPTLVQVARSLENLDAGAHPARLRNVLVTSLAPLLYQQPEIRALQLEASSEKGAFEAAFSARFTERPPAGFVSDFSRLATVLELEGRGRLDEGLLLWWAARQVRTEYPGLSDPTPYAQLAQRYIDQLVDKRILVPDDNGYRFELDYQPGRLMLNGQVMSLPE